MPEVAVIPSPGCLTACVTPFKDDLSIDWEGFAENLSFQVTQGISGIVPVGTTGESPTLTEEEHILMLAQTWGHFSDKNVFCLAGCGSNSTEKALHYVEVANSIGYPGVLLVDPYYNGPSSLEIRENYYATIAEKFPGLLIVPYIIPGRTGCELSIADLAILARKYPNIQAVKEATGNLERMRQTRALTPKGFQILSGDDDKTFDMMTDPLIYADGAISVIYNVAPLAGRKMHEEIIGGDIEAAAKTKDALQPLFNIVTVTKEREARVGRKAVKVKDKFRNPLPIKTAMQGLGMPSGPCRPPLGKMTLAGVEEVRNALRKVWEDNPWVLGSIEQFYNVDVKERLETDANWQALAA